MAGSRLVEVGFEGYTPFGSGLVCLHVNTLHLLLLPRQTAIPAAVTSGPWWTEIPAVVKLKEASFCWGFVSDRQYTAHPSPEPC